MRSSSRFRLLRSLLASFVECPRAVAPCGMGALSFVRSPLTSSCECEFDSSSGIAAFVELLRLLGSARDAPFQRACGQLAALARVARLRPFCWGRNSGAATVRDNVGMCSPKVLGVNVNGWVGFCDEFLPGLLELLGGQVLVGAGEVTVDLEKGVVVGGLGVGA